MTGLKDDHMPMNGERACFAARFTRLRRTRADEILCVSAGDSAGPQIPCSSQRLGSPYGDVRNKCFFAVPADCWRLKSGRWPLRIRTNDRQFDNHARAMGQIILDVDLAVMFKDYRLHDSQP